MTTTTDRSRGIRTLPRPYVVTTILRVFALASLLAAAGAAVLICVHPSFDDVTAQAKFVLTLEVCAAAVATAVVFYALALVVHYSYHTALNIRIAERRHLSREAEGDQAAAAAASAANLGERIAGLLQEINENTLLSDSDKARKRAQLADSQRERLKTEVQQLIAATKWPAARARIDNLRAGYPDDSDIRQLSHQLDAAVKEHREIDIMTSGEQIRSYMSLGLWDKARDAARQLAEKYPDNTDAQKLQTVVRLEEEGHQKDDRLRLYREIEHLVTRKHYRDARRVAEALIEHYASSPEAATLKGQMEELIRNADIETRREMETQIIEYKKQNRHKEAYEVAKLLMEQYPESPQAIALQDQIDKLRQRAGTS